MLELPTDAERKAYYQRLHPDEQKVVRTIFISYGETVMKKLQTIYEMMVDVNHNA